MKWSLLFNSCQSLSDALLDSEIVVSLFAPATYDTDAAINPVWVSLYLMRLEQRGSYR